MVTNIITNLKGSEQGSERDAGDLSWTTWIREERKRERGQTVLLTGLALALVACGGGGSSGGGGTPTQRASLAISEGADTGTVGDGVTNAAEVVLSVKQAPEGAVVRITRDGTQVGELLGLTSVTGGAEVRFASGIVEGQTGTFVATVLTSGTNDTALSGAYEFTVDRELPAEVTLGTTELGTVDNPMVRGDITKIEGTGEVGANVQVRLGEELLGEAKIGEDGTWVVTLDEAAQARLKAGENVLGIVQIDEAGNVSGQRTQRVHVEVEEANRVARLSLVSDTGETGDGITNGETVMLGVSAVEGKTLPAEAVVRITRDGVPVGELLETTSVTGGTEVRFASQIGVGQTGTFVATVVASRTDDTVLSRGYEFTVDRHPPEAPTITMGLGTVSVPLVREEITQVEGTGEAGAKVQVRLGEELLGEARVGEDGTWVLELDETAWARFTVGENVLGIEQEDVAGNVSEQRTQSLHVEVEEANRVARLSLVSDTGVVGDGITNGETVVLGVSAVEGKTLPAEAVVRITRDGEVIHEGLALTGNEGEFRVNVNTQVLEGQTGTFVATVVASATDDTVLSRGYEFTVDRQPPEEVTVVTELGTGEAPVARRTITQVEGTGEAGANVRVRLGEELLGEARVGEDGTWVVRLDEAARARFTVGENVLGIEQEDVAGNVSEQRAQRVYVKVDEANRVAQLSLINDTGVVGDDITNKETVVLGVSAVEGTTLPAEAVVRITRDGAVVQTLELNGATRVEFSSGIDLGQEGTFVARVLASATDDTVISEDDYTFTVDRIVPDQPTITTENLGTEDAPLFRNEVRFEGTGEAGGTVTLNTFNQSISVPVGEDGRWVLELDEAVRDRLQVGENTLAVRQRDVAGNGSSDIRSVTVWVKEDAPIEVKMENDTGVQGDDITSEQTVALVFTPEQEAPDLTNAVVQITKDGEIIHEGLALTGNAEEFQVNVNTQVLEGQTGTFVARLLTSATDDTPLGVRYEFTVDRQTPEAPAITTENLGTVEAPVFRSAVLRLEGTGEAGVMVKVRLRDEVIAQTEVKEDGTFGIAWDQEVRDRLSEGMNTLEIVQEDVAGNVSEGVDWVVVVKDDPQPTASIRLAKRSDWGSSNSDGITHNSDPDLEVTSLGGDPDLDEAVVQITKEGVVVATLELNGATFVSGIARGQEGTFVARVLASAADDTPLSAAYEFTVDWIDPDQPTITTQNVGTQEDPVFRSELPLQFEGTGEAGGTVTLNTFNQNISVPVGEDGRWVMKLNEAERDRLQMGENTLVFGQQDVAGNEGMPRIVKVWVKEDAPIEVKIENDTGVEGDDITNEQTVVLVFSSEQGAPDLTNAVVQITKDGEVIHEGLALTGNEGEFRVNVNTQVLEGQTGTFVARLLTSATDDTLLGVRYEFTVDRQTPEVPTITTENLGTVEAPVFRSEVLGITGTGEVGARVKVRLGDEVIAQTEVREDGTFGITWDQEARDRLSEELNTLEIVQEDVAGNVSEGVDWVVVVKDDPQPTASIRVSEGDDRGASNSDGITFHLDVDLEVTSLGGELDRGGVVVQITKEGVVVQTLELNGRTRVLFVSGIVAEQEGTFVARVLASATDDTPLSAAYEFTVDGIRPDQPTITTQNVGTQKEPVFRSEVRFEGTGEAGGTVWLNIQNINSSSALVGEDGRWVVELSEADRSALQEGENTLGFWQQDVAGNGGVFQGITVWVKKDAPIEVKIENDTGVQGDDITNEQTVVLVFSPEQGAPDLTNAVVQITKDGEIIHEGLALTGNAEEFRGSVNTQVLEEQTGTFVARLLTSATDDTLLGVRYEFTVDRQPPEAPAITTENLGTVEAPVFRSEVLGITGTGEVGARVKVRLGNEAIAQAEVREDGTFGITWDQEARDRLSEGMNTLEIEQEDVVGNVSEGVDWVVVVKDDPQPTASIRVSAATDRGASNSDGITDLPDVDLEVTALGGDPDLNEAVMQITKEGVVLETLELNGATRFRFSSGIVVGQEGTFVARVLASATDDTPLSAAYEFTVERIAPDQPTITTQNVGTQEAPVFRSELPLRIEGTGEVGGTVYLNIPNTLFSSFASIGEDGSWVWELNEADRDLLQEGENTLEFRQRDVAGNAGFVRTVAVWVKEDAPIEVKLETDTGVQGDDITNEQTVALVFTPEQGAPDLTNAVVQITKDGEVIHEGLALTSNEGEFQVSVNTQVLEKQTGTFVARLLTSATDDTPLGVRYEFTVDQQAPPPPTITTENLGTQEDPLFRSEVRFEGTGEAGGSVILSLKITQGFDSLLASTSIREDGRWVIELAEAMQDRLRVGENTLDFQERDVAGNQGFFRTVKVWVKKDAVEVRMENDTGVQGDDITNEQTVALVFSPEQGASDLTNAVVQITKDGEVIHEGLALTSNEGEFRVSVNTQVQDGQTGTFLARLLTSATDDTPLGIRHEFTVDRQTPEAPMITTENLGTVEAPVFRSEVLGIAGTGEARVMMKVRLGDEVIAQTKVREDGTFWITWDQEARDRLSEGLNTLEIVQEDVAGNVSEGVDWVVVVKDDPQPIASIRVSEGNDSGISNSDGITSRPDPGLEVTALGGDSDLGEAVVQITQEGVVVATLELNGATSVEFVSGIDFYQEGTFVARVLASATDDTPLSAVYEFTVDRQPPDLPTITTQNLGTREDPLFRSEVRFEGTGEAGATVRLLSTNFVSLGSVRIGEDGRWVFEMNEAMRDLLKEGGSELNFQQRDVAGNQEFSRIVEVWLKEDAPVEVRMENDTGVQGDDITNEQAVVLVFSPAQGAPDLTNAVVQITKDGEIIHEGLALTGNEGEFQVSVDTGVLEGQTGTFVARLLTSTTDGTLLGVRYDFTVDRDPPVITTESLGTVEDPVFRSEVLRLEGTGEAGMRVKVRLREQEIVQTEVREDGTFGIALDQEVRDRLSEGLNTLKIVQEDEVGNVSVVDWVVVVKNDPQPTASIKLSEDTDKGSSNSDGITNRSDVNLEVTAQEGVDLGEAVVQITKEGVVVQTLELNGETSVDFSSGIVDGQEGTFVARVLASETDDTPLSAAYEFTVDGIRPDQPTITTQNLGTQEDPVFRSELPLQFEGTGEAGGTVQLDIKMEDGARNLSFSRIEENGKWVLELSEIARNLFKVGENILHFWQVDVAGNSVLRVTTVWVKEDGSAVEVMGNTEEVFVETEYAREYAEILGVNSGEDTFYG